MEGAISKLHYTRLVGASLFAASINLTTPIFTADKAFAADSYRDMCTKFVHKAVGKGKDASLEKPAKDLGNIISKLEQGCLLYTSPSPRDKRQSRMPSSA